MSHIAYLAPDPEMLERARAAFQPAHADIRLAEGLLEEGLKTARSLVEEGVEVIIARGGTAAVLKASNLDVILVEIPYSGFDLIRAVREASRHGRRIGMVAFPSMFTEVECLGPILDVELRTYPIAGRQDAERQIRRAFQEGMEVVMGGVTTGQIATALGLAHVVIQTGPGALVLAAEEAKRIQDARTEEQVKTSFLRRASATGHHATFLFDDVLGGSPQVRQTIETAKRYARTGSAVLIQGETGTGKEVFAQSIHNASARAQGPFVAINCAALPAQILESELFGYVAGAFTGASLKGKAGLFELAHGGTLFLDEIAEIDPPTQGKLLRVLQEKKVMRLGGDRVVPVDVRIIAASNRNLKEMVDAGGFRADLFFRLNVLLLRLHPLRERREDVGALARMFLLQHRSGRALPLAPEALEALRGYAWPGNIRELNNVMERLVALHDRGPITAAMIRQVLEDAPQGEAPPAGPLAEIERALQATRGRQGEAAKLLGISRSTLWRRMKRL